jgi:hypothetical protein
MATPPTRRRIFVAWDHSVPNYRVELNALVGGAGLRHEYVARLSGGDDPPGPISEEILRDIRGSDCVLAFLERPNCNVLFEAGYALGIGKALHLRVYSDRTRDPWVDGVRWVSGLPINPLPANPPRARLALERFDAAVEQPPLVAPPPTVRPTPAGSVVLCPLENPARTIRDSLEAHPPLLGTFTCPSPRSPYRRQLDAIDRAAAVAWILPYLTLPDSRHLPVGSAYRDHPENAANAFLAGFAHGRGVRLYVFEQKGVPLRRLLDLDELEIDEWLDIPGLIGAVTDRLPTAEDRSP